MPIYMLGSDNPIETGVTDPNIIGPDDAAAYAPRKAEEIKDVPPPMIAAEVKHLLPIARIISERIGITCLQEAQYGSVLQQIRERSVFVVLNVLKSKIDNGVSTYHGLIVMCKRHPIVRVVCKLHLATGRFGIAQVHTWHKDPSYEGGGVYYMHGDREMQKPIMPESVVPLILDYLESKERVLRLV